MDYKAPRRSRIVIGPDGSPLSYADLPAGGSQRWVVRRKQLSWRPSEEVSSALKMPASVCPHLGRIHVLAGRCRSPRPERLAQHKDPGVSRLTTAEPSGLREEIGDRSVERLGEALQPGGGDPIRALFVFLDLLEGNTGRRSQRRLRHAALLAKGAKLRGASIGSMVMSSSASRRPV